MHIKGIVTPKVWGKCTEILIVLIALIKPLPYNTRLHTPMPPPLYPGWNSNKVRICILACVGQISIPIRRTQNNRNHRMKLTCHNFGFGNRMNFPRNHMYPLLCTRDINKILSGSLHFIRYESLECRCFAAIST